MSIRLGIDVGGTHTDAVLITESNQVVGKAKRGTSRDVVSGIRSALQAVLQSSGVGVRSVGYAMLGTTQCTNAVVERKGLASVAVLRIGAPASLSIPPLTEWPADLVAALNPVVETIEGGHEFDGRLIAPLDEEGVVRFARQVKGVRSVAVSSIFSPVTDQHELRAEEILRQELGPDTAISLSSRIGSMGLLERENATILNAALVDVAEQATMAFREALQDFDVQARLYFSQNDGTLMGLEMAQQYPIFTIASGPTNSLRGAAYLSGHKEAVVIDVGGTTSDIGVLVNGFPRQSSIAVSIGGVRTNFRMPDLISIGLGGGTRIHGPAHNLSVGPDSVGYRLPTQARVFGGPDLTLTDVAVAEGLIDLGDAGHIRGLSLDIVKGGLHRVREMLEESVDRMKTSSKLLPVIAVGGGSFLVPQDLLGSSEVLMPYDGDVANAIGAAMAHVSGESDRVYSLERISRNEALEEAKKIAIDQVIAGGGEASRVEIIDVEEMPLAYLPGNATRIRVKAASVLAQVVEP